LTSGTERDVPRKGGRGRCGGPEKVIGEEKERPKITPDSWERGGHHEKSLGEVGRAGEAGPTGKKKKGGEDLVANACDGCESRRKGEEGWRGKEMGRKG